MKKLNEKPNKWEIVYFLTSKCNQNCSHCWSKNTFLGSDVDLATHKKILSNFDYDQVKEIKFSGGEVSLYKHFKDFLILATEIVPSKIPITIFTNGRFFFDKTGRLLPLDEIKNLLSSIFCKRNFNLHISIDEFHIKFFSLSHGLSFYDACNQYKLLVKTLLSITNDFPNLKIKFKLHCDFNRLKWHRDNLFADIGENEWNEFFIKSEGLIKSGNAKKLKNTIKIKKSNQWSAFILPGAYFSKHKNLSTIDTYKSGLKKHFLNSSTTGNGVYILGWWNLINKTYFGGNLNDLQKDAK